MAKTFTFLVYQEFTMTIAERMQWLTGLIAITLIEQHYGDVIISLTASQITSLPIVYSTVYYISGSDQRKHQSSASLAFVRGIHQWPLNSPHKWPVTRKMFPFDDVIMEYTLKSNIMLSPWDPVNFVGALFLITWSNPNPSTDKHCNHFGIPLET